MSFTTEYFYNRNYSGSEHGFDFYFVVDETATDPIANTSTVNVMYYGVPHDSYAGYAGNSYTYYRMTVNNGTASSWTNITAINSGTDTPILLKSSTGLTIKHDTNGTKTLSLVGEYTRSRAIATGSGGVSTNAFVPRGRAQNDPSFSFSRTVTLTALDRAAAVITLSTSNITASSVDVTATTDQSCNKWEYSLNSGSTWTTFSTTDGTSATASITGLSPANTYSVMVRVTRTYNEVTSTSTVSVDTLGFSVILELTCDGSSELKADSAVAVRYVVYASGFYHKVTFSYAGQSVTETIGQQNAGVRIYTSSYTFPATLMPNSVTGTIGVNLKTYTSSDYSTLVGNSYVSAVVKIPDTDDYYPHALFAITPYSTSTWLNTNHLYAGGVSAMDIRIVPVDSTTGAQVNSASLTTPNATSTGTYTFRTEILGSGTHTITAVVTDTRGRSTTITTTKEFLSYSAPSISPFYSQRGTYANGTWTDAEMGSHIRITASPTISLTDYQNTGTMTITCLINDVATPPDATDGSYYYWTGTSADVSYLFTGTVTDSVGTVSTMALLVASVSVPFNLNVTMPAAAFGKVAEVTQALEIADNWAISIGGVKIPDSTQGGKVLAMKADGSGLEWITITQS